MKKLYLVEYGIRDLCGITRQTKWAVEADNIDEAVKQVLAMPKDELEAEDWAKDLARMETLNVSFYYYK